MSIDHRLAWLAGIIDGEGSLYISAEKLIENRRSRKAYRAAAWQIDIANTDPAMIAEILAIADLLGIHGKTWRRRFRGGNRKPQEAVGFHSKDSCETLLMAVLPYLITKKSRAELMLRAIRLRRSRGHCRHVKTWVPVIEDAAFLSMVAEVRRMNHRGLAPEENGG